LYSSLLGRYTMGAFGSGFRVIPLTTDFGCHQSCEPTPAPTATPTAGMVYGA
jgi:hypothetical protein